MKHRPPEQPAPSDPRSFMVSPENPAKVFRRTIRIEGRPPRLAVFTLDGPTMLDEAEREAMAQEITAGAIVPYRPGAKPAKPEPRPAAIRDEREDDPDEHRHPLDQRRERSRYWFWPPTRTSSY